MVVGLEIKDAIIFLSYFLIYVKNTMEIFYKSLFDDVLVSIHCIFVSWTLAAYLVFLSYVVFKNPFKARKITESDEEEANEERTFNDVEASDDEDTWFDSLCSINCIASGYCMVQNIVAKYTPMQRFIENPSRHPRLSRAFSHLLFLHKTPSQKSDEGPNTCYKIIVRNFLHTS